MIMRFNTFYIYLIVALLLIICCCFSIVACQTDDVIDEKNPDEIDWENWYDIKQCTLLLQRDEQIFEEKIRIILM